MHAAIQFSSDMFDFRLTALTERHIIKKTAWTKTVPRYYFSITSEQPFDDVDGLQLPDLAAAREEASGFARDLMRMEPSQRDWLSWSVRVTGEDQQHLFDLPFLDALFIGNG
jgi:hypothetical protein